MNTKWPSLHLAKPPGTSWMRCLETRFGTQRDEILWCYVLLLHHTTLLLLRSHASRTKLSSSQVVPTVQPTNTTTNMSSHRKCTLNQRHWIANTSLFALRCCKLYQRWISTGKMKIYTIDGSKYCTKNEYNSMIPVPRSHKHPSSGANRPSVVAVTVNINAEFNLMAVNSQIECFSRGLVPEYSHGLESSAVYIAPPFLSNPSLVNQIGIYPACSSTWMQRKIFLYC